MSNNASRGGGAGFLPLLCLLFIGLKLADIIHWSWAWVLAPVWIPMSLLFVVVVLIAVAEAYDGTKSRRKR